MSTKYRRQAITAMRFVFALLGVASIVTGVIAWRQLGSAEVIIEWSTASELDTAGFNLYRGEAPEGPFEPVNDSLIPSSEDPLSGGEYTYEDSNVRAGETYYYLLEDVEYSGRTSRTDPIEVVAQGASRWELVLAVLLAIVSGYGLMTTRLHPEKTDDSPKMQDGLIHEG